MGTNRVHSIREDDLEMLLKHMRHLKETTTDDMAVTAVTVTFSNHLSGTFTRTAPDAHGNREWEVAFVRENTDHSLHGGGSDYFSR